MSKSNAFENDFLKLMFNNVAIADIGDPSGLQPSAAAGNFYIAMHTGDPGETGSLQTTNETSYTGYSRLSIPRTTSGFSVTNNIVKLVNNADFGNCTGNPGQPLTHFSIGTNASGTSKVLWSGTLVPAVVMAASVTPRIANTSDIVSED